MLVRSNAWIHQLGCSSKTVGHVNGGSIKISPEAPRKTTKNTHLLDVWRVWRVFLFESDVPSHGPQEKEVEVPMVTRQARETTVGRWTLVFYLANVDS